MSCSWFVTLTVAPEYYDDALHKSSTLIRQFLEAYRYQHKKRFGKGKSLYHWIVSERGEKRGRLHFHGILFDSALPKYIVEKCWKFGFVSFKQLTLKRCGYVTKYITKGTSPGACQASIDHQPRVWCSAGIGKCYVDRKDTRSEHVTTEGLVPFIMKSNFIYGMPRYYKEKIFTDEERQILKEQYYAELVQTPEIPPPPYNINGWSTSSLQVLSGELKNLRVYVKEKPFINSNKDLLTYGFDFETNECKSSCAQAFEL